MTPSRVALALVLVMVAVLLAAGCVGEQSKPVESTPTHPTDIPISTIVSPEIPIITTTVFPTTSETGKQLSPENSTPATPDLSSAKYVPGEVIVRYDANLSKEQFLRIASSLNREINGSNPIDASAHNMPNIQLIHLPPGVSVEYAITFYEKNVSVIWAQPDYLYHLEM